MKISGIDFAPDYPNSPKTLWDTDSWPYADDLHIQTMQSQPSVTRYGSAPSSRSPPYIPHFSPSGNLGHNRYKVGCGRKCCWEVEPWIWTRY